MNLLVENEEWVEGYEGIYSIKTTGEVYSWNYLRTGTKQQLKSTKHPIGYAMIKLYKDGVSKTCYVHRMLGTAFLPNPDNLPVINHISGDTTDNSLDNLEFCTYAHNVQESYRIGARTLSGRTNHKKGVLRLDIVTGEVLKEYKSGMDAVRDNKNCTSGNISNCCNGLVKSSGGYNWRYTE